MFNSKDHSKRDCWFTHRIQENKKPRLIAGAGFLSEAVTTRLELATSGVTGRHSNQLNYVTVYPENIENSNSKLIRPLADDKPAPTELRHLFS